MNLAPITAHAIPNYTPAIVSWPSGAVSGIPGIAMRNFGVPGAMAWLEVVMPDATIVSIVVTMESTFASLFEAVNAAVERWVG